MLGQGDHWLAELFAPTQGIAGDLDQLAEQATRLVNPAVHAWAEAARVRIAEY